MPFVLSLICLVPLVAQIREECGFADFITRDRNVLMEGKREFRFISMNIPNLHYIEDHLPFDESNPFRLPDAFEMTDALLAVRQMGGQVVRIYTLSVRKKDESSDIARHVLGPGEFNEEAFRALDKVLELANRYRIRLIIPFVDNWSWWGGAAEYAAFRGKTKEAFWTDPEVIRDFKATLEYVINRKNVFTGIRYRDDKAIMAWETGNEMQSPAEWTREITATIKSLDAHHLVADGYFATVLREESIKDPHVDLVSTHHYDRDISRVMRDVRANIEKAVDKKAYFLGEFGFTGTNDIGRVLDLVMESGMSGALLWSLRSRSRDGGFYWHSEPLGGDLYKAYHWPGFPSGEPYEETALLSLVQSKAFGIRGLSVPPPEIPDPPVLLAIPDAASLSWKGSAGSRTYRVERSESGGGPWIMVGDGIDETAVQYRPLFSDTAAVIGKSYYYRIRALNEAGCSPPSNIVGPVRIGFRTLVDDYGDMSVLHAASGALSIDRAHARSFKEDLFRLKADAGSDIVYRTPDFIQGWRAFLFFQRESAEPVFSVSQDGETYAPVPIEWGSQYAGPGEYGYWKPVLYRFRTQTGKYRFLKITFRDETQVSRIEIDYGP